MPSMPAKKLTAQMTALHDRLAARSILPAEEAQKDIDDDKLVT